MTWSCSTRISWSTRNAWPWVISCPALGLLGEPAVELGAPGLERAAHQLDDPRPGLLRAQFRHRLGDRGGELAAVDDRALVGNDRGAHPLRT